MEQSIREKSLTSAFQSNYLGRAAGCTLPSEDGMKSGKRLGKPWGRVCRTGTYSMYLIVKLTQVRIIVLFRFILLSS